ncbi:MAG: hypothetical protein IJW51_01580 [Clostridia bacterium]|nr:hypothetical protein [Clostridia bacterium]
MKVFARVLSLLLVAVMLCLCLTSCGEERIEDGEYIRGDKTLTGYYVCYYFEEETFSYEVYLQYVKDEALSYEGTYTLEIIPQEDEEKQLEDEENLIRRGNITFSYTDANGTAQTLTQTIIIDDYMGTLTIGDILYTWYDNE